MKDIIGQVQNYSAGARRSARAHYKAVDISTWRNNALGIPAILASTIVGTSIFATLNTSPDIRWRIAAGLVALLAASLSALQTFFRYAERAERHRIAAAKYGDLRRRCDLLAVKYDSASTEQRPAALVELASVISDFGTLALESPGVSDHAYRRAASELSKAAMQERTSTAT
jgi:hypothetical protein